MQSTVYICVCDRESEYKYLTSAPYIRPCCTLVRMFAHLTLQLSSVSLNPYCSSVELKSMLHSILFWVSLSLCSLVAAFEL